MKGPVHVIYDSLAEKTMYKMKKSQYNFSFSLEKKMTKCFSSSYVLWGKQLEMEINQETEFQL